MYSIKLIFFVNLWIIICANSDDPLFIHTKQSTQNANSKNEIFDITENSRLYIMVENLDKNLTGDCEGHCNVSNTIVNLSCHLHRENQPKQFLNVSVTNNITKNLSGHWKCDYLVTELRNNQQNGNMKTIINTQFRLNVTSPCTQDEALTIGGDKMKWVYVGAGILALIVLLVILIQTYCIIRYKKKANAMRREAQWSNKKENTEDTNKTVRYSKMPGLKKNEVMIPEARESGIYEDLEVIRSRAPPELPPLPESFPINTNDLPNPSPAPTESNFSSPFWSSLLRRKNKKLEEAGSVPDSATSTLDKRTTLDRIKERPPLATPDEGEIYEDVMETPKLTRKDIKIPKEKAFPREDFRGFQPKPKLAPPPPTNLPNVVPPLNPQLIQAVANRNRLNPVQTLSPPPKPLPKAPPKEILQQNSSSLSKPPKIKAWANQQQSNEPTPQPWLKEPPPTKPWEKEPTPTKPWQKEPTPTKPWQKEPTPTKAWANHQPSQEPTTPKDWAREPTTMPKPWQKEPKMTKPKEWPREPGPQEIEETPQPIGSLRPKVAPYNPGLPPPDAPPAKIRTPRGNSVAKPKPPPPVKPKQLHPLPPPPCEPESVHPQHDDRKSDDDDSESEWTYEPLPQYNIYSM